MLLYASSMTQSQILDTIKTNNPMIVKEHMTIMILIMCIFVLSLVLLIVYIYINEISVFFTINLLSIIVTLAIYIILVQGKSKIQEYINDMDINIKNLNDKKNSVKDYYF